MRENFGLSAVGGVASILIPSVAVVRPAAFCAQHVCVEPVVGPGIVMAAKQLVEVALSDTDQCRTTLSPWVLPRYQPLVPAVPSIVKLMLGVAADAVAVNIRTNVRQTNPAVVERPIARAPSTESGAGLPWGPGAA